MLDLRSPDGAAPPWQALWQRHPLLVLLAHEGCERCDRVTGALVASREQLAADDARALVVCREPRALQQGVVTLHDPEGRLARALGVNEGVLLAVDRFFEVRRLTDAHAGSPEDAVREALGSVDLSLLECPECGAPTW